MSKDAKPTIYSIAKRLNLSPSAVSRALNHPGRMSEQTEDLIRRTAHEMGYVKVRQLRRPTSNLVAALTPNLSDRKSEALLRAAKRRLDARSFHTLLFEETDMVTGDGLSPRFLESGATGAILYHPLNLSGQEILKLAGQMPVIAVDRNVPRVVGAQIDPDQATEQALDALHAMGHAGLVYLQRETPTWVSEHVGQLLAKGCAARGMQFRVLHNCLSVPQAGSVTLERFLRNPASAVFASTGNIAAGFAVAAQRRGIRIPQDLSLVMLGDNPHESVISPVIAQITEPMDDLGRQAAETLIDMIEDPRHPRTIDLRQPSLFLPGASIAKPNTRRSAPASTIREDPLHMQTSERITLTVLSSSIRDLEPLIERYQQEHPNIEIQPQKGGMADFDGNATNQNGTLGQEGTLAEYRRRFRHNEDVPDLLLTEYRNLPQLESDGMLLNFSAPLIENTYKPRFRDDCWQAVHRQAGLYGVPSNYGTMAMFYRTDILDRFDAAPPRTWHDLIELGARIRNEDPTITLTWLDTIYTSHYVALLRMGGEDLWQVDDDADRIDLRLNTACARRTAALLQDAIDSGVMHAGPFTGHERDEALRSGNFPIIVHANWQSDNIARVFHDRPGLWKVAMPPSFGEATQLHSAMIGGGAIAISSKIPSSKRAAALHFAFWAQSNPTAVDLMSPRTLSATQYFQRRAQIEQRIDPFFQQQILPIFLESASLAPPAHYLPFSTQTEMAFQRTMVPFLKPGGASQNHLADWQEQLAAYAISRGYTVATHDDE